MVGSVEALAQFNLRDHGDRHEQQRWPLLCDRFSQLRGLLAPVRGSSDKQSLSSCPSPEDTSWIRLRVDIPLVWYQLAVCHYSVFYQLSRATARRIEQSAAKPNQPTHPEDVIFLLQTCCESVSEFYNAVRAVGGDLANDLPRQLPHDFPVVFRKIDAYRNLLIHGPVLGRGEQHGETLLPKLPEDPRDFPEWKERSRFSWTEVETLGTNDLVPARVLLQELEDELVRYLDTTWANLIRNLSRRDPHHRFKDFLRVPGYAEKITVLQPNAASGVSMK